MDEDEEMLRSLQSAPAGQSGGFKHMQSHVYTERSLAMCQIWKKYSHVPTAAGCPWQHSSPIANPRCTGCKRYDEALQTVRCGRLCLISEFSEIAAKAGVVFVLDDVPQHSFDQSISGV